MTVFEIEKSHFRTPTNLTSFARRGDFALALHGFIVALSRFKPWNASSMNVSILASTSPEK